MSTGALVLAGDVGGTKTDLALYPVAPDAPPVREARYASADFRGLPEVLREFLKGEKVAAAAFGLPGPVIDAKVVTTNLPWKVVDAATLLPEIGTPHVQLLNDLETTALGALRLPAASLKVLNAGKPRDGNRAVIAAGTGLGQAFLYWDGEAHRPSATEGGHVDFAPLDEREDALLRFLRRKIGGHVSYERIVSGPGLFHLFDFLDRDQKRHVEPLLREKLAAEEDRAAVIGQAGVDGSSPVCEEAVELFVRIYGAQAGNLALTVMATGGVYVGGGVVNKLLPRIEAGGFMDGFVAKGRYQQLMSEIPVKVILDPACSRHGAAVAARALLAPGRAAP